MKTVTVVGIFINSVVSGNQDIRQRTTLSEFSGPKETIWRSNWNTYSVVKGSLNCVLVRLVDGGDTVA